MRVFIAGKISDDTNYVAKFASVEAMLQEEHIVVNPAKLPKGLDYESYLDITFAMIRACDAIYCIDESKGSLLELHYAKTIGRKIL